MSATGFEVFPIRGAYLVRKEGGRHGGRRPPRQHDSFAAAEAEALRLAGDAPGVDFVITQEVARITLSRPRRRRP